MHFATNIVRETYLALAIGDHLSFRVDEYANLHPDLFEKPGYGWHIGNNPGVSMVGAIPYALARPAVDAVVERVNRVRAAAPQAEPPPYASPWPLAREFYDAAWRRGLDVKFGLATFVMQSLAMAPSSALGVVVMFYLLRQLLRSDRAAVALAALYAFGTPVFFRTGYLNQNMMLGHIAVAGFAAMWNPGGSLRWPASRRYFVGGIAGGTAVLFDYSGVVLLTALFAYGSFKLWRQVPTRELPPLAGWYAFGASLPIALLWFYQWQSFGNPFLPGQQWMPPVEWSDLGYQGYGPPQGELAFALLFDYRFGLFASSPLMLLACLVPFLDRRPRHLPRLELTFILAVAIGLWLFFSGSNYTRLQFNTGIRYLAPALPFLFVPVAVVLTRLPGPVTFAIAALSVTEAWSLAMYRDVERGLGVLDPLLRLCLDGFQLPVLATLARTGQTYGDYLPRGGSPLPLFLLTAVLAYWLWSPHIWRDGARPPGPGEPSE
jgi:hypothetical protein